MMTMITRERCFDVNPLPGILISTYTDREKISSTRMSKIFGNDIIQD